MPPKPAPPRAAAPARYRRVRTVKNHRLLTVAVGRRRGKRSRRAHVRMIDTPILASQVGTVR